MYSSTPPNGAYRGQSGNEVCLPAYSRFRVYPDTGPGTPQFLSAGVREMFSRISPFARYAWVLVLYSLAVILWGAYVRATGSGAGCGNHWPLCNGQIVPRGDAAETRIEFTHRAMSGAMGIGVVLLWILSLRSTAKKHPARKAAVASCAFLVLEILLGALLVMGPRANSPGGIAVLSIHSTNTLLLLAAIVLTAWFAGRERLPDTLWRLAPLPTLSLALTVLAAITGAIAAKGDTLFFGSVAQPLIDPNALLRLRLLHPTAAIGAAVCILVLLLRSLRIPALRTGAMRISLLITLQLGIGVMNVLLLAPISIQMAHLLVADLLWITLLLLSFRYSEEAKASRPAPVSGVAENVR